MTEIDNDKLLKDFFAENKREIADNGFSRRVMHHLPDRSNRLARLWTVFVMAVGATLFVTLGGLEAVWETLKDVLIGMINHGATSLYQLGMDSVTLNAQGAEPIREELARIAAIKNDKDRKSVV